MSIDIDEIFSITRTRPAPKPRAYRVTWPCGSTWDFDRHDLEIPEYANGEQNGITHCYGSLREARQSLEAIGCTVEFV